MKFKHGQKVLCEIDGRKITMEQRYKDAQPLPPTDPQVIHFTKMALPDKNK